MYADYRELLARKDIDAVMIAAQDHWHALIATAAAKAGKDMYCEKPLGVSVEEGQCIRDAVRKAKRVFQTGTWQRSQGKFQQACELARNGYLGKIHTVEVAAAGPEVPAQLQGLARPAAGAGRLRLGDVARAGPGQALQPGPRGLARLVPDLGLLRRASSPTGACTTWTSPTGAARSSAPSRSRSSARPRTARKVSPTTSTRGTPTFTYASGLKMVFTDSPQQKTGLPVHRRQGLGPRRPRGHLGRARVAAQGEAQARRDLQLTDSKHHQDNFLDCVRSRKDPVSDVDAAYQASTLGLVADIAGRLGQKLKWDPKQERSSATTRPTRCSSGRCTTAGNCNSLEARPVPHRRYCGGPRCGPSGQSFPHSPPSAWSPWFSPRTGRQAWAD